MTTVQELARGLDFDVGVSYSKSAGQTPSAANEHYEVLCVTHGAIEFWIEDQYYRASGGDILLIPAGAMLSSTLKQRGCPCGRYSVWLSRRYMDMMLAEDDKANFAFARAAEKSAYLLRLPVPRFEELYSAIEAVIAECSVENQMNANVATKSLIAILQVQLNRVVQNFGEENLIEGEKNRLSPVLSHIHDNCTTQLTVEQVAEQFGYSSSHLAHSFKKQIGTSLYHYVLLRRLQIGREAMLKGTPVKEAYQMCGFGDYAGFYRAFTKEFGLSPQQYKKRATQTS